MNLVISSYSAFLLGVVALSSMGANAKNIEDVINMINTGEVEGSDTPVFGDGITEDGVTTDAPTSDITEDMTAVTPVPVPPTKPVTCIDRSLEVSKSGPVGVKCIKRDEAICRGDWMFGIVPSATNGTYQLTAWEWDPLVGYTDIAYASYDGAERLCVGKTERDKGDTAFMFIETESDGTYYLVCDSVGKLKKNPKLKIRVRKDREKRRKRNKRDWDFYDTIVKYRRGANDDDTLWSANTDGSESANGECYWKQIEDQPQPELFMSF